MKQLGGFVVTVIGNLHRPIGAQPRFMRQLGGGVIRPHHILIGRLQNGLAIHIEHSVEQVVISRILRRTGGARAANHPGVGTQRARQFHWAAFAAKLHFHLPHKPPHPQRRMGRAGIKIAEVAKLS